MARNALQDELGAPPPRGLVRALEPEQLDDLAAALRDRRRAQRRALAQASDQALRHVPALLRPVVRKIAGG